MNVLDAILGAARDGDALLLALEREGYIARSGLFDVGTTAEPNIVDVQEWASVVALNHAARIAPRATAGETVCYTLEVDSLDHRAFDKIAVLRKAKWQVRALPTSRSILLVIVPASKEPTS